MFSNRTEFKRNRPLGMMNTLESPGTIRLPMGGAVLVAGVTYTTIAGAGYHPVLAFSSSGSDATAVWGFAWPQSILTPNVDVDLKFTIANVSGSVVRMAVRMNRIRNGEAVDSSWDINTATDITVPTYAFWKTQTLSIALSSLFSIGDGVSLALTRESGHANDTLAGGFWISSITLRPG